MHFDRNPFTCSCKGGKDRRSRNGFKFGTFIGRFPKDSVASMAVKGLTPSQPRCHLKTTNESAKFESLYIIFFFSFLSFLSCFFFFSYFFFVCLFCKADESDYNHLNTKSDSTSRAVHQSTLQATPLMAIRAKAGEERGLHRCKLRVEPSA